MYQEHIHIFYNFIILVWNVYCYFTKKAQLKKQNKKKTFIVTKGRKVYWNFDI